MICNLYILVQPTCTFCLQDGCRVAIGSAGGDVKVIAQACLNDIDYEWTVIASCKVCLTSITKSTGVI